MMSSGGDLDVPAGVEAVELGPRLARRPSGGVVRLCTSVHVGAERHPRPARLLERRRGGRAARRSPPVGSSTCRYTPYADFPQWAVLGQAHRERRRRRGGGGDELGGPAWSTTSWTSVMWAPMRPHITGSQRRRISSSCSHTGRRHEQHDGPPQHVAHRRAVSRSSSGGSGDAVDSVPARRPRARRRMASITVADPTLSSSHVTSARSTPPARAMTGSGAGSRWRSRDGGGPGARRSRCGRPRRAGSR